MTFHVWKTTQTMVKDMSPPTCGKAQMLGVAGMQGQVKEAVGGDADARPGHLTLISHAEEAGFYRSTDKVNALSIYPTEL